MKALAVRYFKSKLSLIIVALLLIPTIGQFFWNPNALVSISLMVLLFTHATFLFVGWFNYKREKEVKS